MWRILVEKELMLGKIRLSKILLENAFKLLNLFFKDKPCMLLAKFNELKSLFYY